MVKTDTYNPDLSISKLSNQVFGLNREYKLILRAMALNGPSSLAKITRFTENSNFPIKRWVVRKKIRGTRNTMGLVPSEYLYEVNENKHRYGKQEKTYYLTVKGLIATLSTGIRLEKIDLYRNFVQFLNKKIPDEKLKKFVKNLIKIDIHLFLFWHSINGIQLTKQRGSNTYLTNFLLFRDKVYDFKQFPVNIDDNKLMEECLRIKQNYIVAHEICSCLINSGVFQRPQVRLANLFKGEIEKAEKKWIVEGVLTYYIVQWPLFIEKLQQVNFDDSKIDFGKTLEPTKQIEKIDRLKIYKEIVNELKNMSQSEAIPQNYIVTIKRNEIEKMDQEMYYDRHIRKKL